MNKSIIYLHMHTELYTYTYISIYKMQHWLYLYLHRENKPVFLHYNMQFDCILHKFFVFFFSCFVSLGLWNFLLKENLYIMFTKFSPLTLSYMSAKCILTASCRNTFCLCFIMAFTMTTYTKNETRCISFKLWLQYLNNFTLNIVDELPYRNFTN